jgi:uncharacterized Tic20 family protein
MAYSKFKDKKKATKATKIAKQESGHLEDWEVERVSHHGEVESNKSICLFITNILVMVLNMFLLFGMVMVTFIVWAIGDEELSLIQEHMPHYDQNVLSFALYQIFTLIPFCISLVFQVLNFYLITLDTNEEIMWYLSKGRRGMKIINGCLLFSLLALFAIMTLYSLQGGNYEYYFGKSNDGLP